MKTIPPPCPEPEAGLSYWRSLDQLAETPEFRQWVEREFPAGASEWRDPISRRHFVKIMSASFLLAGLGLTGCRRPEETIVPFTQHPEGYVHGEAQFYATAMPQHGLGHPLLARANEGCPTKVEGNALFSTQYRGTDAQVQASILNLYDPDRAMRFAFKGNSSSRTAALDFLATQSKALASTEGEGFCVLMEPSSSPSRQRLQEEIQKRLPKSRWFAYEPAPAFVYQAAATLALNQPARPFPRLEQARTIISLDWDFLGNEMDATRLNHDWAKGRRLRNTGDSINRLYVVESLMTVTGMNADHRMRLSSGQMIQFLGKMASELLAQAKFEIPGDLRSVLEAAAQQGQSYTGNAEWVAGCVRDLIENRGRSLVYAGYRQPLAAHLIALAINAVLGNFGKTIEYLEPIIPSQPDLVELADVLNAGQVKTLLILGSNPVYNAPADLNWAATQRKAGLIIRLGYYEDETFAVSDWHFPKAHYLESWGDIRSPDGSILAIQPLIQPLFGGMTELEVLAQLGGLDPVNPYAIVQQTLKSLLPPAEFEATWKDFLHDGFLKNSASRPVTASIQAAEAQKIIQSVIKPGVPSRDNLEVVFFRDYKVDDGDFNNNGWLQEMPDPITKICWDNAVLMSRRTAQELGVSNQELVDIQVDGRQISGPVWIQPGMADFSLGIALGYGREKSGRVGQKTGFNAYRLRSSRSLYLAGNATLKKTGKSYPLACTQDHWSMEGRPIIREATFEQYRKHPDFAKKMALEEPPGPHSLYVNPLEKIKGLSPHQWGMSIDLNACTGCGACVLACQSENNVPIVGKDQVNRGREMHWLRIDRYYAGDPSKSKEERIDDPQTVNQPMLCQHCETAPCEYVCPVNATVHDEEGLNVMAYNRCVGTRYCSNNCPYKVRRFNYFDYNKRPIQEGKLYWGPLAKKPAEELELIKLARNPDVSVRMRGVMEKCTFCIQRIEQAKIKQKVKAKDSGDVAVPDGTIQTACQQACPTEAIVFGNVADPNSAVSKLKTLDRDYAVLEFLNTRPRLTYLARVRNPNPSMPDAYEAPMTTQEQGQQGHGTSEAGHGAHHEAEKPAHSSPDPSMKGAH